MMMRYLIVVWIVLFSGFDMFAQDIHFSQFNNSPMTLNPAFAGVNGCSYRFVANYKAQWTNLDAYQTVAASYDMAVGKTKPKGNFGGFGVSLFSDKAGDVNLRTSQVNFNASYSFAINQKGNQYISTGVSGGVGFRSFDLSKVTTDSQFGENGFNPDAATLENFTNTNKVYADIGAGLLWNFNPSENSNYYAGFAVSHLNQPGISFFDNAEERLYLKVTFHGGGVIPLNQQFALMPSFMYLNQGPHNQLNFGSYLKMRKSIIPSDQTAFYFGAWYRWKDAVILATRVDIGSINIGFSYDLTFSKLSPATINGGPELSFIYTGCFNNKKSQVKYCPNL